MSKNMPSTLGERTTTVPSSTRPRRKSRRWIWIVLLVFVLLGAFSILGWNFTVKPMLAEEQYYIAIYHHDYTKAYGFLGSSLQARLTLQAFTLQAQQQDATYGKMTSYTESNYPFGDPANITETVKRANGTTYTAHIEMRQEGGQWKVTSFDRI